MRLIDADALLEEVRYHAKSAKEQWLASVYNGIAIACGEILDAPTIEAEPVRHGYWTDDDKCSMCGFHITQKTRHYCPSCGAKNDG